MSGAKLRGHLECPTCHAHLPVAEASGETRTPCPACDTRIQAYFFPAFWRDAWRADVGQAVLSEDECHCFYHENKRAVRACDRCGRFVCPLCEVEFDGEHVCPQCVAAKRREGGEANDTRRVLYGAVALALATLPLVTIWGTLIGAPAALFMVVYYWRRPDSVVGGGRWRFVLAGVLALLQLTVWLWLATLAIASFI